MQNFVGPANDHGLEEENSGETVESNNLWQSSSVSKEKLKKWQIEKEKYDEVLEYIKEVDEILNLIKPFPRGRSASNEVIKTCPSSDLVQLDSQIKSSNNDLTHLEKIIKLVEQLKELRITQFRFNEEASCHRNLRRLRDRKKKMKFEELMLKSERNNQRAICSENEAHVIKYPNRRSKSVSNVMNQQEKRNSNRLSQNLNENKSKVSKWTKVKEAFHWERASHSAFVSKSGKKELLLAGKSPVNEIKGNSSEHEEFCQKYFLEEGSLDDLDELKLPSPPPSPPSLERDGDFLTVPPPQDLPSSSSSDKLDEFSLREIQNKTPDADFSVQFFGVNDPEYNESRVRKSSCEELMVIQSPKHLCQEKFASCPFTIKTNKTTWDKMKDIIQTRKGSLKKNSKKINEELKKRRKFSAFSISQFSDHFEDLSLPEEKSKNLSENTNILGKNMFESLDDPSSVLIENKFNKKLKSALTITLPRMEELKSLSCENLKKGEFIKEDQTNILNELMCQAQYCETKPKFTQNKFGQNQRLSRWVKVKRVFLTSSNPPPSPSCLEMTASPTDHKHVFFSDMESDDLSSGEWIDDKATQEKLNVITESTTHLQEDIRKSYNELQKKLSQEFNQKLREWELKNESTIKSEEVSDKPKLNVGNGIVKFRKARNSITVPLPSINDLSPEFKKKLNDWNKIKTSRSSASVTTYATKEDIQGQNLKVKFGEWQPWRMRCTVKPNVKCERGLTNGSVKKANEVQKIRNTNPISNRKKDETNAGADSRKTHSRTLSGNDPFMSSALNEKDGKLNRKAQKITDFQWVEKELQKIEREKIRLEQEREKYLEREARLEQMKRTIGTTFPTQELLVRTPTGFIRFKGISKKFTKKLYEWEKARGIAPEASTFALIEESVPTNPNEDSECEITFERSKFRGSVPELSSVVLIQGVSHHASSLSLNDVDDLKNLDKVDDFDSLSSEQMDVELTKEPGAIIVDVEDVIEETALIGDPPTYKSEVPVYTYASDSFNKFETLDKSEKSSFKIIKDGNFTKVQVTIDENYAPLNSEIEVSRSSNSNFEGVNENDLKWKQPLDDHKDSDASTSVRNLKQIPVILEPNYELPLKYEECHRNPTKNITPTVLENFSSFGQESKIKETSEAKEFGSSSFLSWEDSTKEVTKANLENSVDKKCNMQGILGEAELYNLKYELETENIKEKNNTIEVKKYIQSTEGNMSTVTTFKRRVIGKSEKDGNIDSSRLVNVFVPTSRKIISPVKTHHGMSSAVFSYVIDDVNSEIMCTNTNCQVSKHDDINQYGISSHIKNKVEKDSVGSQKSESSSTEKEDRKSKVNSKSEIKKKSFTEIIEVPNFQKSFNEPDSKETSPSIKMIIAKYNQKILERNGFGRNKNENDASKKQKILFLENETQKKLKKYGKENDKNDLSKGRSVKKCASYENSNIDLLESEFKTSTTKEISTEGSLKSNDAGMIKLLSEKPKSQDCHLLNVKANSQLEKTEKTEKTSPYALRTLKIQKAKEDFLSGRLSVSSDASVQNAPRYSEIQVEKQEVDSNKNFNLNKSISGEAMSSNNPSEEKETFLCEKELPKSPAKFDISSIKSKFRKIRIKKDKESKLNSVTALCRQSLLIDVPSISNENSEKTKDSKSCPPSPVMNLRKMAKNENDPSFQNLDKNH